MQAVTQMNTHANSPLPRVVSRPIRTLGSAQAPDSAAPQQVQPDAGRVRQAVARANAKLEGKNEGIQFSFSDVTGQLVVQVVDQQSGAVIRQIPSKEFIAAEAAARESTGLLLDGTG